MAGSGEKSLDDIILSIVAQIAGPDAVKVAHVLLSESWLTDEVIASKTLLKLNQVRKILYSLLDNQLMTYKKVRDENSGWYTYYWTLNKDGIEGLALLKKRQVLRKLKERLEFEKGCNLYKCPQCEGVLLSFDEAIETYFRCPSCGQQLETYDNERTVKVLEAKIAKLEKELRKNRQ
ncbi:MAG: transcription factor [Thermoprotei archaeon]|nr:MAG: transcription factor [Thermoprotei archaeon]